MKSDIQAGRAYVELLLKDSKFLKGLDKAGQKLKSFGSGVAMIGASISAAGAGILAPFAAATADLMSMGDELDKMRQRTGMSVEALSELEHAAGQSDASLEDIGKASLKLSKNLVEAADGSKTAREAFDGLGLSVDELSKMNPEEQFMAAAKAVGAIENPTERAAKAMEIFGKGGAKLLPMIEDLDALRQEARDLGFTMSGETAGDAVKLGDMLANLWKTVRMGGITVATTLLPSLIKAVDIVQNVASAGYDWVRANKDLFLTIAQVAVGVIAAGAAITGLGLAIAGAGVVLSGLAAGIGMIGSLLGMLLSPIGLIGAALVGAVVYWTMFTDSGKAAIGGLVATFQELAGIVTQTIGGITDALSAGDIALAGQIAMTGLAAAWYTGLDAINSATGGALTWLQNAFNTAFAAITFAFHNWRQLGEMALVSLGLGVVSFSNDLIHFFGTVIPEYLSWFNTHWTEVFTDIGNITATVFQNMMKNIRMFWDWLFGLFTGNGPEFNWTPLTDGFKSAMTELPKIAERQMGPLEKSMQERLDKIAGETAKAWDAHAPAIKGPNEFGDKARAAQEDLNRLTTQASAKAEEVRQKDAADKAAVGEDVAAPPIEVKKQEIVGSFSAAALAAQGAGGGQDKQVRTLEQIRDDARRRHEAEMIALRDLKQRSFR